MFFRLITLTLTLGFAAPRSADRLRFLRSVRNPAQNGAVVVTLHDADSAAVIHYTEDGSTPTAQSPQYFAPFLVTAAETVKAIAISGQQKSDVASQALDVQVAPGALVWSDEFANATGAHAAADAKTWIYEAGGPGAFGNHELEVYLRGRLDDCALRCAEAEWLCRERWISAHRGAEDGWHLYFGATRNRWKIQRAVWARRSTYPHAGGAGDVAGGLAAGK